MAKPVVVALYVRVSTEMQTTENQVQALTVWAEGRGWKVGKVYTDTGSAYQNADQRQLRALLEACRLGKHRVVLVYDLSRLTRRGVFHILNLLREFDQYGTQVLSMQQSWLEMPDQFRDLFIAILGWVASFESEQLSQRIKAGLARTKADGQTLGRPKGSRDARQRRRRRSGG